MIDHILIQKIFRSCIKDKRSFRGAYCDTDHFIVVAKFTQKIQSHKGLENRYCIRINPEMLENKEVQQKYSTKVGKYVENVKLIDMDEDWIRVSKAIKEIAVKYVDKIKKKKKK